MKLGKLAVLGLLSLADALSASALSLTAAERYPLDTYTERVTVEFASAEDAKAAEAKLMVLPPGKKVALVSRWDSSGDLAFEMAKVLSSAGAPGTFYPGSCEPKEKNDRLVQLGQGVGTYRATHGNMPGVAPEPQWEMIMSYRIEAETAMQNCISTMALPYFSACDQNPDSGPRLGEAFLRAGYCGSTEPWGGDLNKTFALSPKRWVNAIGLSDWTEGKPTQKQWDTYGPGAIRTAQQSDCKCGPVVMIGVHPPHEAENRALYVPILKGIVANPEVWACGKPDYDAWFLEYLNGSVRKVSTDGAKATFEVTRLEPWETGGKGGCALAFTKPAKNGVDAAVTVTDGVAVLGMTAPHVLPTSFKLLKGGLNWNPAAHRMTGAFTNDTGAALTDLVLTLRLPRSWTDGVRRVRAASLAAGASLPFDFDLPGEVEDPIYKGGTRYFALQVDAVKADQSRARWYMETREKRPNVKIPAPRDLGRWVGPCTNALDVATLKALSVPGAKLVDFGTTDTYNRGEVWKDVFYRPARVRTEVMLRPMDWAHCKEADKAIRSAPHFVYSVFEFEADADGYAKILCAPNMMLGRVKDERFRRFTNGEGPETREAPLKVKKGTNRLLFAYSIIRDWTSFEMNLDVFPTNGASKITWTQPKTK